MNHLLIFTIGPVQSFIENSRKARDMYAGSQLLSQLMAKAVKELQQKSCTEVIFPLPMKNNPETDSQRQMQHSNMPNRLIAKFKNTELETLQTIASDLESSVRNAFLTKCVQILSDAGIDEAGMDLARIQLQGFLEIYWMYEKYTDGDYAEAYQRLFSDINAVKGIRPFEQSREPWGRSCILFPEYNAIFAKQNGNAAPASFPRHVNRQHMCDLTHNKATLFSVKTGEALSAIALVKRMYERPEIKIYSIRLMLLKSRVEETAVQALVNQLNDGVSNALYDLVNKTEFRAEQYQREELLDAKKLYQYIETQHIALASYYALVKFDGDSMGETFIREGTEEKQKALSQKIEAFAHVAPEILSKHGGLPVFAGGEDFFGFLPVDTLFICMQELRKEFQSKVGLTFSAGIVIAHLMQPLKEVVSEAGMLEKEAKKAPGKNAFAVSIMKRSGERLHMAPYKMDAGCGLPCLADVAELTGLLKDCALSRSLFFNISRLFEPFRDSEKMLEPQMAELLIRDCVNRSALDLPKISGEKILEKLMMFYRSEHGTGVFLSALNAISFIAREVL